MRTLQTSLIVGCIIIIFGVGLFLYNDNGLKSTFDMHTGYAPVNGSLVLEGSGKVKLDSR